MFLTEILRQKILQYIFVFFNNTKFISIILLLVLVSACATRVIEKKELPDNRYAIRKISVSADHYSNATIDHVNMLESVVANQLVSLSGRLGEKVDLKLLILKASFVSQGTRVIGGMLSGANHFNVKVTVIASQSTTPIGVFIVNSTSNPGGLGAFFDPIEFAANEISKKIIAKIFGN